MPELGDGACLRALGYGEESVQGSSVGLIFKEVCYDKADDMMGEYWELCGPHL